MLRLIERLGPQLKCLEIGNLLTCHGLLELSEIIPHLPVIHQLSISAEVVLCGSVLYKCCLLKSGLRSSLVELQLNACYKSHPSLIQMSSLHENPACGDGW